VLQVLHFLVLELLKFWLLAVVVVALEQVQITLVVVVALEDLLAFLPFMFQ
jgi:hypothetical protein